MSKFQTYLREAMSSYARADWPYYYLTSAGKLVDKEDGTEPGKDWPTFKSIEEADQWLQDEDIRGDIIGKISDEDLKKLRGKK